MTDSEFVKSPLLNQELGSVDTDFVVEEVEEGPGHAGGIPFHRHRREDEAWYVISGRLSFRFGQREFDVGPGSGVLLPHGTPHTFWNPGPAVSRYLLIVGPKTAALLKALHGPARPDTTSLKELYSSYDVDLLD